MTASASGRLIKENIPSAMRLTTTRRSAHRPGRVDGRTEKWSLSDWAIMATRQSLDARVGLASGSARSRRPESWAARQSLPQLGDCGTDAVPDARAFRPDVACRMTPGHHAHDPARGDVSPAASRPRQADRCSSGWPRASGSGSRGARIHTSCAVVVVAPTLDRAFARWCSHGPGTRGLPANAMRSAAPAGHTTALAAYAGRLLEAIAPATSRMAEMASPTIADATFTSNGTAPRSADPMPDRLASRETSATAMAT